MTIVTESDIYPGVRWIFLGSTGFAYHTYDNFIDICSRVSLIFL